MSAFARVMILTAAVGAGSWVGLGRPDGHAALAAGKSAVGSLAQEARAVVSNGASPTWPGRARNLEVVPALEREPRTVDASALPDPNRPLPQLNPDARADRAWLVAEGPEHPPGDGRRLVTFTFDDGPSPETAPALLHVLETHHIRATFFFIGEYLVGGNRRAAEVRDCARRIADAGHFIGNHTLDHKLLTNLPRAAALADIDDSAVAIEKAIGERPRLFRPPYGELDPVLESALHERHLDLVLWSIDVEDMKKSDPDEILASVEKQLLYKQGGIVLLHDVHTASVKAFHRLVHWLLAEQVGFATTPSAPAGTSSTSRSTWSATAASPQPYATRRGARASTQDCLRSVRA